MNSLIAAYGRLWARTATERAALRLYHRGVLVIVAAVPFAVVGIVLWPATLLLPDSLVVGVVAVTAIPVALAILLAAALLLTSVAAAGIELTSWSRRPQQGPPEIETIP